MADVLTVEELARLKLTRNGQKLHEQIFSATAESYTRQDAGRVVLDANMSNFQQVNLGDINTTNTGEHFFLRADRAIVVAFNSTAKQVVADLILMHATTITALYLKNTDANNTATVEYIVTD